MEQRDLARSVNYLFTVSDNRDATYNVQSANVADINLGVTPFGSRYKDLFIPSNKIETENLIAQILISDDHREWLYFYKWMLKCKNNGPNNYALPCELTALDSQNQESTRFIYLDCFPTNMEGIQYSSAGESTVLSTTVSFRFNQFKIVDVNGNEIDESWNGDL